ncbi:cell division protein FtsQ/DivIB [Rubellimicrobium arenae]|uniref:cell division protein FtsQ/DivIB n=1 Tax=Rubellimicrobium arenae TaxID=2817372 RepID=UPI001FF05F77|nr:cell division protein FtsQ/DivIB [Rubellimicrobium arenae]
MRTLILLWRLTLPSLLRVPMVPPSGGRRDPAPSVWSYRYQRLMLTPFYRRLFHVGLPAGLVTLIALLWLASADNRAALSARFEAWKDAVQDRPEFMVTKIEVTGADRALMAAIREVARLDLPLSSFDLDVDALRLRITDLTAVRSAQVRVNPGGTLEIAVAQRNPVAVWRYADGLRLIDAEGVMTGMIAERADRSDLPLIAGDGAKDAIDEALALFAAAAPIAPRVRGLVRMGERRWDMVLDNDLRILLPTEQPVQALERVIALHQAQELLDRDVAVVDMRLGDRPTVRLNPPALATLRAAAAAVATTAAAAPVFEDH